MEGTVDRLVVKVETSGVAASQKQLNSLIGTLKTFRKLNQTMTGEGVAQEAQESASGIAAAGEEAEVAEPKFSRFRKTSAGLASILKSVGSSLKNTGKDGKNTTGIFGRLGNAFTKTNTPLKDFLSTLKRIAMYRMLRSIIKAITSAIGEGITNIYNYSRAVGTSLAPAMDKAKSATLTFKNSIGAALAPVLESLVPIIQKVCGWLTTFNNLLGSIFAGLAGKKTFTAAVETTTTWGEALDKTTGSAKELKRTLLGFDELNVLNGNTGGGGGGGGASTPDYSSMFEERDIPEGIRNITNMLHDAVADFALELSVPFKNVIFKWTDLTAEDITAKATAALLTIMGFAIGGIPGAIIGFVLSLVLLKNLLNFDGKLDKEEIAKLVMTGLLGLVGGVAGTLLGGGIGGVIGFTLGALLSLKLSGYMFDNDGQLSKEEITSLIVTGLCGLGGAVIGGMIGGLPGALVGFALGVILKISLEGIYEKVTGSKDPAKDIINKLLGKTPNEDGNIVLEPDFQGIQENTQQEGGNFFDWFGQFASRGGYDVSDSFTAGYEKGSQKGFKSIGATSKNRWQGLTNDVSNILQDTNVTGALDTVDKNMGKKFKLIKDSTGSHWVQISGEITNKLKDTDVTTPFTVIDSKMNYSWEGIESNTESSVSAISSAITSGLNNTNIKTPMNTIKSNVSSGLGEVKTTVKDKTQLVANQFKTTLNGTDVKTPMDNIKSKISSRMDAIKDTLKTGATSAGNGMINALKDAGDTMVANLKSTRTTLATGPMSGIVTAANEMGSGVVGAVNQIADALSKVKFSIPAWASKDGQAKTYNPNVQYARYKNEPMPYAEGGFVSTGELFIARERGPELVGSVGGRTAVANNDQIVAAVSEGVYRAVSSAMGNSNTTVNVDGKKLFEIVTERNNSAVRRTGRSPLLT